MERWTVTEEFLRRRERIILGMILLFAFVLRFSYLTEFAQTAYFNASLMSGMDQMTYDGLARIMMSHPWYGDGTIFYGLPAYQYFLALVYRIFGAGNYFAAGFVQILLDTGTVLFIALLARSAFGVSTGILAAFFTACYRPFVFQSPTLLNDTLVIFLQSGTLLLLYRGLTRQKYRLWMVAGFATGVAALARPNILLLLPFLPVAMKIFPGYRKNIAVSTGLLLLFTLIAIAPVTIRNWQVGKVFVPICSEGSNNWKIGNSYDSSGGFNYPRQPLIPIASVAFWKLQGKKALMFFNSYERPDNLNVHLLIRMTYSLRFAPVTFGFIVPLGLVGFFLALRRKETFLLSVALWLNVLWVIAFFIVYRFRFPSLPAFIIFASFAVVRLAAADIRKDGMRLAVAVTAFVLLAAFVNRDFRSTMVRRNDMIILRDLTFRNLQQDERNNDGAAIFRKAKMFSDAFPRSSDGHLLLSIIFYNTGEIERSHREAQTALACDPANDRARNVLRMIEQRIMNNTPGP